MACLRPGTTRSHTEYWSSRILWTGSQWRLCSRSNLGREAGTISGLRYKGMSSPCLCSSSSTVHSSPPPRRKRSASQGLEEERMLSTPPVPHWEPGFETSWPNFKLTFYHCIRLLTHLRLPPPPPFLSVFTRCSINTWWRCDWWTLSGIDLEPQRKGIPSTQPTSCLPPAHLSIDKSHHIPPLVKVPPWLFVTLTLSSSSSAWAQAPHWWPKPPLVAVSLTTCTSCSGCSKLLSWYNPLSCSFCWALSVAARPCPAEGRSEEEDNSCLVCSLGLQLDTAPVSNSSQTYDSESLHKWILVLTLGQVVLGLSLIWCYLSLSVREYCILSIPFPPLCSHS